MSGRALFLLFTIASALIVIPSHRASARGDLTTESPASAMSDAPTNPTPSPVLIPQAQAVERQLILYRVIRGDAYGAPPGDNQAISRRTFATMLQRALDLKTSESTRAGNTKGVPYYIPIMIAVNAYSAARVLSGDQRDCAPISRLDAVVLALRLSLARHVLVVGALPAEFPKFADEDKIPVSKRYEVHLAAFLHPNIIGLDDSIFPNLTLRGSDAKEIAGLALDERLTADGSGSALLSQVVGVSAKSSGGEPQSLSANAAGVACT